MQISSSFPIPFSLEFSCNFICFSNSVSAAVTQQSCYSAWTQPSSVNAERCPRQNLKMIPCFLGESGWRFNNFIFSEGQLFFPLIFSIVLSLSFISALVFMISTNWVLFVLSLVALGVRLGLFPDVKLYGYKIPLRTAFPASHMFWVIVGFVFICLQVFSLTSKVIYWFFSSILFSLHVFVFFTSFFL